MILQARRHTASGDPFAALREAIQSPALRAAREFSLSSLLPDVALPLPIGFVWLQRRFSGLLVKDLLSPTGRVAKAVGALTSAQRLDLETAVRTAVSRRLKVTLPPPVVPTPSAPESPESLLARIQELGLDALAKTILGNIEMTDEVVNMTERDLSYAQHAKLTLRDALFSPGLSAPLRELITDALEHEVSQHAAATAQERETVARLRGLSTTEPLEGFARDLEIALWRLWEALLPLTRSRKGGLQTRAPNARPGELTLEVFHQGDQWIHGAVQCTVAYRGPSSAALGCACGEDPCEHRRFALLAALTLLRSPPGARVAAEVCTPRWQRALERLAPAGTVGTSLEERRVVWEVHAGPRREPQLRPRLQKRGKRGAWNPGTVVRPSQVLQHPVGLLHEDLEAARLLEHERFTYDQSASLVTAVLGVLHAHPRVTTQNGAPVRFRRARLELILDATLDGYELLPTLDGDGSTWDLLKQAGPEQRALVDSDRGVVLQYEMPPGVERLLTALAEFGTHFPKEARERVMDVLGSFENEVPTRLAPALLGVATSASDEQVVRLIPTPEGLELTLLARPLADSSPELPGDGPNPLSRFVPAAGKRLYAQRDLALEVERGRSLATRLGLPALPSEDWRAVLRGEAALDLIGTLQALDGPQVTVQWPQNQIRVARPLKPSALKVQITEGRDWFGIRGSVDIDGDLIELAAVLQALKEGRRYVAIGKDRWVSIEEGLRTRLSRLADASRPARTAGTLEVGPAAAAVVEELTADLDGVDVCAAWTGVLKRLHASQAITPTLPVGLKAELRPYQVQGFSWLLRLATWGVGGVLADDMGLGKTVQALAVLLARQREGPALVVAPTSVCFNWIREAQRFAPELRVTSYRGGDREKALADLGPADVLVASYGLVTRDLERFTKRDFATLILDEAQAAKNAATQRAKAMRDLRAGWKLAITGTPMENHLGELWSLFQIVSPGLLGGWEHFREKFALPIESRKDPERMAALARLIRPFLLRRTKDQVARDLPARTEIVESIILNAEERTLYDAARLEAIAELDDLSEESQGGRFKVLAAITRLRQLACHPRLVVPDSPAASSKLQTLVEILTELRREGHRALVFSQFVAHLSLVREALTKVGIDYLYLDGSTPERERIARVDAFQKGQGDAFLISLKAGGTGLNLTGADYVVHLDPWWNPAVEDQATDRAHRIGQTRPVTVYRLVSKGTIEESILALHQVKRDLVSGLLAGTAETGKLTTQELMSLIRSGASESV